MLMVSFAFDQIDCSHQVQAFHIFDGDFSPITSSPYFPVNSFSEFIIENVFGYDLLLRHPVACLIYLEVIFVW